MGDGVSGHCEECQRRTVQRWIASSLSLLAMTMVIVAFALSAHAEDRVLNIYNWTDYIDPGALERFQKETGITIQAEIGASRAGSIPQLLIDLARSGGGMSHGAFIGLRHR